MKLFINVNVMTMLAVIFTKLTQISHRWYNILSFLLASLFYVAFNVYFHDYPVIFHFFNIISRGMISKLVYAYILGLVEGDVSFLNKLKDFLLKVTYSSMLCPTI